VKYFIDTSIIIDLLSNKEEAKEKIKDLINEEDSELFINRLVLTEALRTMDFNASKKFIQAEEKLELFQKLEIKPEIYTQAITFSRFCKSKGVQIKGKCASIDFLHFMTAKYYKLEIITNDKDFNKLEKAYTDFNAK